MGSRRGPSHWRFRLGTAWVPGFIPAKTIDSKNSRIRFMVVLPQGRTFASIAWGCKHENGAYRRKPGTDSEFPAECRKSMSVPGLRRRLAACAAGFGEQGFEGAEIIGAAHHDEGVAGLHRSIGGGARRALSR